MYSNISLVNEPMTPKTQIYNHATQIDSLRLGMIDGKWTKNRKR